MTKALATAGLGLFFALQAYAGGSSTVGGPLHPVFANNAGDAAVLNHPVVLGVEKLLNDKYSGACSVPSSSSLQWFCLGAIPPVVEPTVYPSSCLFDLKIDCPAETATISGRASSFFLAVPEGSSVHAVPTDKIIVIENIGFQAR